MNSQKTPRLRYNREVKAFKSHLSALPRYPYQHADAKVKLDQNESPYELPAELKARALEKLAGLPWNRYPELHAEKLREALAEHLGWDKDALVAAPGSNLLIQSLVYAANQVLDTSPSFPYYAVSARLANAPYRAFPLRRTREGFELPLEDLLAAMDSPPGVLFLPSPHAPTGMLVPGALIHALAQKALETGWLLVLDEAYHQFSGTDYRPLAASNPQVALLRTFSKAFGLGGIRAGYLLAPSKETANAIQNIVPPFVLPAHTAAILETVLEAPAYAERYASEIQKERERVYAKLREHPSWRVFPSSSNFLLIKTPDAEAAYLSLLKAGVLVRRQDQYPLLEGCIRASIGSTQDNNLFLDAAFNLEASHA